MMIDRIKVKKEKCGGCYKFILTHNKIVSCEACNSIVHAKCASKTFEYDHLTDRWLCYECAKNRINRYNPFDTLTYDKHDPNNLDYVEDIIEISNILKNCQSYDHKHFNTAMKILNLDKPKNSAISTLFNNIDGNASNFDTFVSEISQFDHTFSVIAIAETNIDACHKNLYTIPNYNSEYNSRILDKKKGSGLGLYVHSNFTFNRIDEYCKCSPNMESLFIKLTNTETPFLIGLIYRPPSGRPSMFMHEFEVLMKKLPQNNVIIMGDFNTDLFSSDHEFEQILYSNNMIPTISIATHEKPGCNPSLIDNILINSTNSLVKSGVLECNISHHHPLFSVITCCTAKTRTNKKPCPSYDYCESNIDKFLIDIKSSFHNRYYDYTEENFIKFNDVLNNKIDEHFKTDEKTRNSKRNRLVNPWITNGIIASVHKKQYLYKQWKKTVNKLNKSGDSELYSKFWKFRKILKAAIKYAKKNHYSEKFKHAQGNIKKTWEIINELRGNNKHNIKALFVINGRLVEDRREISNEFNLFFSTIAKNMNTKLYSSTLINVDGNHDFKKYMCDRVKNSIYLSNCDSQEVDNIIKNLENGKASDIPIIILKRVSKFISCHLSKFINYFINNGIFPEILKIGKITPIYKKDDPQLLSNYRPISTLPVISKIFEKIVYNRLYSFLTSMNVIYDKQFGFRKSHSTSHAINYSVNRILNEIENKNHVIGAFIDLSKAFDTINHNKLLIKLEHYGIRGICLNLLKSYLTDRTQYTVFDGEVSDSNPIEYGVPQGSVLGPLLFLIYINDIVNSSELGHFVLFADDTNIFIVGKTEDDAYRRANIVLEQISKYMACNELHINMTKCTYMHFRPRYNNEERQTCARTRIISDEPALHLNGVKLKKVVKTRFLGVMIDDKLNWDAQLSHLDTKLKTSIVMIKRISKFIPKSEYLKIYNALFQSHLSYCISCWGGVSKYKLQKIFSIQKRCIRLLFGNDFSYDHSQFYETCARTRTYTENTAEKNYCLEHTKPIFNKNGIMCIYNLYIYHTFMETFKVIKDHSPISIYNLFNMSPRYEKLLMIIPAVTLDKTKQNFVAKSASIWNRLICNVLNKCSAEKNGIVIPGSHIGSDMSASIAFIKNRLKIYLLSEQKKGDETLWELSNFVSQTIL